MRGKGREWRILSFFLGKQLVQQRVDFGVTHRGHLRGRGFFASAANGWHGLGLGCLNFTRQRADGWRLENVRDGEVRTERAVDLQSSLNRAKRIAADVEKVFIRRNRLDLQNI